MAWHEYPHTHVNTHIINQNAIKIKKKLAEYLILGFWKLRQEDCCVFEASLGYIVSPSTDWDAT